MYKRQLLSTSASDSIISQSGSLDLNIESVFAFNIDSFQIMNRYCSHHFHHLLTSGSDSTIPDKFLKFLSYMLLFNEKDKSKQRSDALSDIPIPPGVVSETKLGNISGLRLCLLVLRIVGLIIPLCPVSSLWESQFAVVSQEALI